MVHSLQRMSLIAGLTSELRNKILSRDLKQFVSKFIDDYKKARDWRAFGIWISVLMKIMGPIEEYKIALPVIYSLIMDIGVLELDEELTKKYRGAEKNPANKLYTPYLSGLRSLETPEFYNIASRFLPIFFGRNLDIDIVFHSSNTRTEIDEKLKNDALYPKRRTIFIFRYEGRLSSSVYLYLKYRMDNKTSYYYEYSIQGKSSFSSTVPMNQIFKLSPRPSTIGTMIFYIHLLVLGFWDLNSTINLLGNDLQIWINDNYIPVVDKIRIDIDNETGEIRRLSEINEFPIMVDIQVAVFVFNDIMSRIGKHEQKEPKTKTDLHPNQNWDTFFGIPPKTAWPVLKTFMTSSTFAKYNEDYGSTVIHRKEMFAEKQNKTKRDDAPSIFGYMKRYTEEDIASFLVEKGILNTLSQFVPGKIHTEFKASKPSPPRNVVNSKFLSHINTRKIQTRRVEALQPYSPKKEKTLAYHIDKGEYHFAIYNNNQIYGKRESLEKLFNPTLPAMNFLDALADDVLFFYIEMIFEDFFDVGIIADLIKNHNLTAYIATVYQPHLYITLNPTK